MNIRSILFLLSFVLTILLTHNTDFVQQISAQVPSPACLVSCPIEPNKQEAKQTIQIINKGGTTITTISNKSSSNKKCRITKINLSKGNGLLQVILQLI